MHLILCTARSASAGAILAGADVPVSAAVLSVHADNEASQIAAGVTTSSGTHFCRQCNTTHSTMFRSPEYVIVLILSFLLYHCLRFCICIWAQRIDPDSPAWRASALLCMCMCSVVRDIKSTRNSFEPAWAAIERSEQIGLRSDVRKRTGITRVSALRDYPGLRPVFHSLFAQDPMHDFCEGVLLWVCQMLVRKACPTPHDQVHLASSLNDARERMTDNLRYPKLESREIASGHWHLSGTKSVFVCGYNFGATACLCFACTVMVPKLCSSCVDCSQPDVRPILCSACGSTTVLHWRFR